MDRTSRVVFAVLLIVVAAPALALVIRALGPVWFFPNIVPSGNAVQRFTEDFGGGRLWRAAGTSVALATLTGAGGTVLALIAARSLARARRGLRHVAEAGALLPVVMPPIALGVGVHVLALQLHVSGSLVGVLGAHLIPAAGYVTLYLLGVFSAYEWALEDEARTLGAGRVQVWTRVTLPLLRARLAEAVLLGALVSWGQLALTLVVGGGAVRTLPVELLAFLRSGDDHLAAVAALLLSIPPAAGVAVLARGMRSTGGVV